MKRNLVFLLALNLLLLFQPERALAEVPIISNLELSQLAISTGGSFTASGKVDANQPVSKVSFTIMDANGVSTDYPGTPTSGTYNSGVWSSVMTPSAIANFGLYPTTKSVVTGYSFLWMNVWSSSGAVVTSQDIPFFYAPTPTANPPSTTIPAPGSFCTNPITSQSVVFYENSVKSVVTNFNHLIDSLTSAIQVAKTQYPGASIQLDDLKSKVPGYSPTHLIDSSICKLEPTVAYTAVLGNQANQFADDIYKLQTGIENTLNQIVAPFQAAAQAANDKAAKAAADKALQDQINAAVKKALAQQNTSTKKTVICVKGNITKKIKGSAPKCPTGYKLEKKG